MVSLIAYDLLLIGHNCELMLIAMITSARQYQWHRNGNRVTGGMGDFTFSGRKQEGGSDGAQKD